MADGTGTLPPQIQQQIATLQSLNQQYQATLQQKAQYDAMRMETEAALAALESLPDDAPVYRNVGALLVRDERKAARERLQEDLETGEVRVKRLASQESALREQLNTLQQKIQSALQGRA